MRGCAQRARSSGARCGETVECHSGAELRYFWPDVDAGAREQFRVLRPGRRALCGTKLQSLQAFFGPAWPGVRGRFANQDLGDYERALRNAGFVEIESTTVDGGGPLTSYTLTVATKP
jgi:hypothetical protein